MIILKPSSLVSAFLLLIPAYAFAWNNGNSFSYSSLAATAVISSSSGTSVTPSYQGISTSSDSYSYYTSQGITIPDSFMSILNKLDISQNVVPSEATIQNALKSAKDLNSKPLEGNAYKYQLIAPLCTILNSDKFSTDTKLLALQNLAAIANNEKVDYKQKIDSIPEPVISYIKSQITEEKIDLETANSFSQILMGLFASTAGKDEKFVETFSLELFNDQTLRSNPDTLNSIFIAHINALLDPYMNQTQRDNLIDVFNSYLTQSTDNDDIYLYNNIILAIGAGIQNTAISNEKVNQIAQNLVDAFKNIPAVSKRYFISGADTISDDKLQKMNIDTFKVQKDCLGILLYMKNNMTISEDLETQIDDLALSLCPQENREFYKETGVLILKSPEVENISLTVYADVKEIVSSISAAQRCPLISLQTQVLENDLNVENTTYKGTFSRASNTTLIKLNTELLSDPDIKQTLMEYISHENGHYVYNNILTSNQQETIKNLYLESTDVKDFVSEYGATNSGEDFATIYQSVRMDYSKDLFNRATTQGKNNDKTLLKKYELAQQVLAI